MTKHNKNIELKCAWHIIAEDTPYPEGNLNYCKYKCLGYNFNCGNYIPNNKEKDVLSGIERYFRKYRNGVK